MNRPTKLDLTLFHKLVDELENSLEEAYEFRDNESTERNINSYYEFVIKISKSLGYLTGIANEAQLLGADLNKITQNSITDFLKRPSDSESLEDYLKSLSDAFAGSGRSGSSGGNVN